MFYVYTPLIQVFAGRETVILFAHQLRAQRSLDKFLNLLHLHGFTESLIPFADHDAYFRKEIISIYRITRRGCAAAAEEEEIVD